MVMNSGYCYGFLVVIMVITGYFNGIQLQRSEYVFQGPPFFLGETKPSMDKKTMVLWYTMFIVG